MRALLVAAMIAGLGCEAMAQTEADYVKRLCAGWRIEVRLDDRTRIDCLSDTHAIEVDFTKKWAEAVGQALHYGRKTGRIPGLILVCLLGTNEYLCLKHSLQAEEILAAFKIRATIWRCPHNAAMLDDCVRRDF